MDVMSTITERMEKKEKGKRNKQCILQKKKGNIFKCFYRILYNSAICLAHLGSNWSFCVP